MEKPIDVGGIRVKSIIDHNGEKVVSSRVFEYNVEHEKSDGTLLSFPRYLYCGLGTEKDSNGLYLESEKLPFDGYYYSSNTMDKSHIEYRNIREKYADGSSIVYSYSNFVTHEDNYVGLKRKAINAFSLYVPPTSINSAHLINLVNDVNMKPNSKYLERGKLMEKRYYDALGRIVKSIKFDFEITEGSTVAITPSGDYFNTYQTYTGDFRNTETTTTEYYYEGSKTSSINTSTELDYNDKGQVIQIRTNLPDGTIKTKHIDYYGDSGDYCAFISRIYNGVMQKQDDPEYILSEEYTDYRYAYSHDSGNLKPENYYHTYFTTPIPVLNMPKLPGNAISNVFYQHNHPQGRLTEITVNGITTSYIWGYGNKYVVAILKNVTNLQLLRNDLLYLLDGVGVLTDAEDSALRSIPGAEVTTLRYKPYFGVTSVVDPSGRKTTYEYDYAGRLIETRDAKNNLMKKFEYNIQ
jgi:YD repeat-containing protein